MEELLPVLGQTGPFFAIVALGWGAAARGFWPDEATGWLTRFVFYFALSAMLFGFAARLDFADIWNGPLALAYLAGTGSVYLLATLVALARGRGVEEAAIEAQASAIGNVGFLGVPLVGMMLGLKAVGVVMLVLSVDLVVFGSLIVIIVSLKRGSRPGIGLFADVAGGLMRNPMIVSIALGLAWSASGWALPAPADRFLTILGGAATPGALFAIGASLAGRSAERLGPAFWLSTLKLIGHPAAVLAAIVLTGVPLTAHHAVAVAAAAMPTAGNVYILARHWNIAPRRASATILVSTVASVLTLTATLAWVTTLP